MTLAQLQQCFLERFDGQCTVAARAPGRVNLIGEHTDYNDGFVLPIATERETWVAAAPRDDGIVRVYSASLDSQQTWPSRHWKADSLPHWTTYVAGVDAGIRMRSKKLGGYDLYITSDVPSGGGLSSSAALEVATTIALANLVGILLDPVEMIDLSRRAEHEYAGVPCGLMDQSVSVLAEPGAALLLDCRSREYRQIPCELGDHVFVVIDTGVRHKLASSEYAKRQQECNQAVEYFRNTAPEVQALRDVSLDQLDSHFKLMSPLPAARARHVVSENERTQLAAEALTSGELERFGRLMSESHRSLRDDYQVSCAELDQLVRIVSAVEGVLGARMTGGGFGGCVVALVRSESIPAIEQAVDSEYRHPQDERSPLIHTHPGRGASLEYIRDA